MPKDIIPDDKTSEPKPVEIKEIDFELEISILKMYPENEI